MRHVINKQNSTRSEDMKGQAEELMSAMKRLPSDGGPPNTQYNLRVAQCEWQMHAYIDGQFAAMQANQHRRLEECERRLTKLERFVMRQTGRVSAPPAQRDEGYESDATQVYPEEPEEPTSGNLSEM